VEAAPVEEPAKPKPVLFKAVALFDCEAEEPTDLGFVEGDVLDILDDSDPGWWEASMNGISGIIPSNYVHQLKEGESPADVLAQRDAELGEDGEGDEQLDQLDQLVDEALATEDQKDSSEAAEETAKDVEHEEPASVVTPVKDSEPIVEAREPLPGKLNASI